MMLLNCSDTTAPNRPRHTASPTIAHRPNFRLQPVQPRSTISTSFLSPFFYIASVISEPFQSVFATCNAIGVPGVALMSRGGLRRARHEEVEKSQREEQVARH